MATEKHFLEQLNQHLGIAHKISRAYQPDADERADLLQEMVYQLWRSYPSFTGQAKFSTWMYSVCLHTALADRRTVRKRQHEPLVAWHEQIPDPPLMTGRRPSSGCSTPLRRSLPSTRPSCCCT
ncbi:sigma-70 family RNA polymerase sigma factor [Hymenobacter volaticus]|uniref:Sigma-70 family RNA polymerase sigma factor n=1 Tax=Hymenobacter volaticus TaxID=2932254 RepID=A0ABY4GEL5_9BACT|nr:sigma-70 family RNA polymerase sigma factor [Hymenobacter volaticus]UOQ69373.1 sigma-70 family RNA polymerase sigma factor [Hymenobacter volaticus]